MFAAIQVAAFSSCTRYRGCCLARIGGVASSYQRVVVADKAVEPSDAVVERARGRIVLFGCPIEPGATTFVCDGSDRFDQLGAAALAADRRVNKQILQIADLSRHPRMGVKEIVSDP